MLFKLCLYIIVKRFRGFIGFVDGDLGVRRVYDVFCLLLGCGRILMYLKLVF